MGSDRVGMKVQARLPESNKPFKSELAVPKLPVSAMRGKNAARAAPMWALLARNWCSAEMMSGRLTSSSEGTASVPWRSTVTE